jgi:hypothetical protein
VLAGQRCVYPSTSPDNGRRAFRKKDLEANSGYIEQIQPSYFAVIETCIDLGIFRLIAHTNEPKSVADLAVATGASEELLGIFSCTRVQRSIDG